MTSAISEAETRYSHIVRRSLWDFLFDLCLGKGLADRRQKSGLEKAYWEAVAARRAAGENVTLPGEFTEGNFPGPRAGFAFSMEDDEEEDPDKPMFEKFILEDGTFDHLPLPPIYPNGNLDENGNPRRPTDLPGWFEWDYGRRHLARERGTNAHTRPEVHRGYGFFNAPDPEISRLAQIFGVPEHERWDEYADAENDKRSDEETKQHRAATYKRLSARHKNGESSTATMTRAAASTRLPLTATKGESSRSPSRRLAASTGPVKPSLKGKEKAVDPSDEDTEYDFDACADDSGCALLSCSSDDEGDNPVPKEFLEMH